MSVEEDKRRLVEAWGAARGDRHLGEFAIVVLDLDSVTEELEQLRRMYGVAGQKDWTLLRYPKAGRCLVVDKARAREWMKQKSFSTTAGMLSVHHCGAGKTHRRLFQEIIGQEAPW